MITIDELLKYLNLDIDEFLFQFQSHPNYPSALAISDTLNFLGIENSAYELDKEYWSEIPNERSRATSKWKEPRVSLGDGCRGYHGCILQYTACRLFGLCDGCA